MIIFLIALIPAQIIIDFEYCLFRVDFLELSSKKNITYLELLDFMKE